MSSNARPERCHAVQVFNPYGSPYTLPFPSSAQPTAVTAAPNLTYPQSGSGGLMALADAATDFGLRFTGASTGCGSC